jgi:hypothetical protein
MGTIASPIEAEIQVGLLGNKRFVLTWFFGLKGLKAGTDPEPSLDEGNTLEGTLLGPGVKASSLGASSFGEELLVGVALTKDVLEEDDVQECAFELFVEVALVGVVT